MFYPFFLHLKDEGDNLETAPITDYIMKDQNTRRSQLDTLQAFVHCMHYSNGFILQLTNSHSSQIILNLQTVLDNLLYKYQIKNGSTQSNLEH